MSFDLDTRLKLALYGWIAERGEVPTSGERPGVALNRRLPRRN